MATKGNGKGKDHVPVYLVGDRGGIVARILSGTATDADYDAAVAAMAEAAAEGAPRSWVDGATRDLMIGRGVRF